MEEALGADGHGFLEQHDALIGLVAEKLQGGKAARRRRVEMLPAARGYDKAFCCGHVGVLPCVKVIAGNSWVFLPKASAMSRSARTAASRGAVGHAGGSGRGTGRLHGTRPPPP